MEMNVDTFAYDVLEGLNDDEACFIISPSYKQQQLKRVKELSTTPFRVIEMGKSASDGYMLDPSKCGVQSIKNETLIHKGSYQECCRFVATAKIPCKVILLEPEYEHFCFIPFSNEII